MMAQTPALRRLIQQLVPNSRLHRRNERRALFQACGLPNRLLHSCTRRDCEAILIFLARHNLLPPPVRELYDQLDAMEVGYRHRWHQDRIAQLLQQGFEPVNVEQLLRGLHSSRGNPWLVVTIC